MSWKPEVIADATGEWYSNALRFATEHEAYESAHDLACRWLAVRHWRATECDEPVTHRWDSGKAVELDDGWRAEDSERERI